MLLRPAAIDSILTWTRPGGLAGPAQMVETLKPLSARVIGKWIFQRKLLTSIVRKHSNSVGVTEPSDQWGETVPRGPKPGLNMNSLGNNPDGLTPNDRSRYERAITMVMRWRGQ